MRICLIVNPNAGPRSFKKQLHHAETHLTKLGCKVERVETTAKGDATALARQAAQEQFDIAMAVGGDGTINEVCNGLVNSDTAMAVLPAGTANVFAAEVGIPIWNPLKPDAVLKAADIAVSGQHRKIDLGQLQMDDGTSRYFLMWCGIGLDAAITEAKESSGGSGRSLGYASWVVSGLIVAYDFMGTPATIKTDNGETQKRVLMAVVSNGQLYGRVWRLAPRAKMDDGFLDVAVMVGHRWPSTVKHLVGLTFKRHVRDPDFYLYRTSTLSISAKHTLPVHVDAETVSTTPADINVVPGGLRVVIPRDAPRRLFK